MKLREMNDWKISTTRSSWASSWGEVVGIVMAAEWRHTPVALKICSGRPS